MKYSDYKKARNLAWEVLIQEEVTALPVMIGEICNRMGIPIRLYSRSEAQPGDGFTTRVQGVLCIFIDKDCSPERQRFTAAHELGHILLGHVGQCDLVNREPSPTDNPIEQAANVFASRLLAPACVLADLQITKPEEIAALCQISYTSAKFRAARMDKLYGRNRFDQSLLEQRVYQQFKPFIRRTKMKRFWKRTE